jgi:ribosome biogenesis GTP-binding protein YsxC/EngB
MKGPEVAVIGRSNVGKSTLINAICHHTSLARTSEKPGLTDQINFYEAGSHGGYLVDMPGYGFAFQKPEVVESWKLLISHYFSHRTTLSRVLLLIDSRVGLKQADVEMMDMLEKEKRRFQVVMTKCEVYKTEKAVEKAKTVQLLLKKYTHAIRDVSFVTALKGGGINELRSTIQYLLSKKPS